MDNIWSAIFKVSIGVVILVSMTGVIYVFVPEYNKLTGLQQKKEELVARNAQYEAQIHDYQNRQNRFQTDPRFVERLVREQFGMVKDHETIYKVIHDAPPPALAPAP